VGSRDGNVYAFNASTGLKIWSYKTGSVVGSSPAIVDGVIYVGSFDHTLYALNASTGDRLWNYTFSGIYDPLVYEIHSSPAIVNGVVYVGGGLSLYAFSNQAIAPTTAPENSSLLPTVPEFPKKVALSGLLLLVLIVAFTISLLKRLRKPVSFDWLQ
jgi:WD40 repeat protein